MRRYIGSTNETMHNKQSKRLIIILAIFSFILILSEMLISQNISSSYSKLMMDQRKKSVSKMVHLAHNAIKPIIDDVQSGELDRVSAREKITDLVRNMTYEDEYGRNYIFMSSYEGIMLVQPFEAQKEGSDQWNLQDSNGRYIIRELVQAAREKPGGAFVAYDYYLPDEDRIEEKLSFVIGIPEIDAYVGTGMYLESSYKELQGILIFQRYGILFTTIFILGAATFSILTLLKANQNLTREIRERMFAESNMRTVFNSIHDTVFIHDRHGKILLANKRAGSLYGIPENQVTEYSLQELSYDSGIVEEKLLQADQLDHSSLVFEWKCKRPMDGVVFDGEVALRKSKWSGDDVLVAVVRDISERKKHEEEVHYLAFYDFLTSLHNRVYIMDELNKELKKECTREINGAILFIDLDNFKEINDSFGHFFGDEVLIQLAEILKKLASDSFLPARIGGDEFVILCRDADLSKAEETAEKILEIFRSPIVVQGNTIHLTCSIGIARYPRDGHTVEDIFKNADMAMYSAKYKGKDSFVFYEDDLSTGMQHKIEMEKQLREAYYNSEFMLYYQPLFDIKRKKVMGYEALIRWDSPKYGMVSPNKMIPLAEEIGLIDKIGNWVIDKAFAFAKSVQPYDLYISCNVSSVQLSQSSFVDHVLEKFDQYQLKKGSVALEITESCLIKSFFEVSQKLSLLREKGILIYLDDFGTGYSSLNYLKKLPVDKIKIDKSFIDEITNSGMDSKILKTIISLAHDIGIETVAEGVETEEQFQYLEICQCDLIQGYYLHEPKPEELIKKDIDARKLPT